MIENNISEKFIKLFSIINSIKFLENFKDIQKLFNYTTSYNNINKYTKDCYIFLNESLHKKGGRNKTKKFRNKFKQRKTSKNKKKAKKTYKNKIIKHKKFTRKFSVIK